ncbi:50S ribosomal protein L23 domain protein [Bacteroides pyogenes F0041]|uniref:50S ribosomal protein L23 domain protein n=1 Tax=Bacteroides pyogenes F0041 TaxID=1321819 RepID=U2CVZ8_9BACE|nr:50S ribosomal protein L23 domain protein [Bacteroides pyogenes F0041]GAE21789.1 hypothetical protein JCM10003_1288 [Bacteroides pyogenes JCM 10003]
MRKERKRTRTFFGKRCFPASYKMLACRKEYGMFSAPARNRKIGLFEFLNEKMIIFAVKI